jgi:hypothetical protein
MVELYAVDRKDIMSWPSVRDFDGKPILGFVFEKKLPVMRERKEWAAFAYEKACEFVAEQTGGFIAEDLQVWYNAHGYEQPHSGGCWGPIWRKLQNHDVICRTGERRKTRAATIGGNRNQNCNLAIVWRAKV